MTNKLPQLAAEPKKLTPAEFDKEFLRIASEMLAQQPTRRKALIILGTPQTGLSDAPPRR